MVNIAHAENEYWCKIIRDERIIKRKRLSHKKEREPVLYPSPTHQRIRIPPHKGMGMPGVGLRVRVVGLGSQDLEFKSHLAVELIPGGVDSACHPSEVGKMSASLLVSCVGVVTRPELCPIAKETAWAAPTFCTEDDPNGWMMDVVLKISGSCV